MKSIGLKLRFFLVAAVPAALAAQPARPRDEILLRYWQAPLYLQAERTPSEAPLPAGANPLVFVAMTPCRVVDTRASQGFPGVFGAPSLAAGVSRTFPLQSSANCSIPARLRRIR
jgi:hypothetical protein